MLNTLLKCPNNFVSSKFLKEFLDPSTKIKSYGLKSGHIETDLVFSGFDVTMTTNRYYVWEFWRCLINSPYDLLRDIKFFHNNFTVHDIGSFKNSWFTRFEDPYERSAIYYLLNRYSESGALSCPYMSKHNFSNLNLISFENSIPLLEDLNLSFTSHEELVYSFKKDEEDLTILMPIGKYKRNFILNKEVKTIDTSNYNFNNIKKFMKSGSNDVIMVFKYDIHADRFFDNKIYIDKYGEATDSASDAEEIVVTNIEHG